jgi:hypothetical protein
MDACRLRGRAVRFAAGWLYVAFFIAKKFLVGERRKQDKRPFGPAYRQKTGEFFPDFERELASTPRQRGSDGYSANRSNIEILSVRPQ